ncbi:hypothetical protein [Ktedonobacter racemifer]|uniref:hypothetical protein n=1 Tax=Ktedonobacter racemifer TaxID=363277 RepID=UPI00146C8CBB|nr:hypothetical protein [Ktedonobacter racemifer]
MAYRAASFALDSHAAHIGGQVLKWVGKTCSLRMSFTSNRVDIHAAPAWFFVPLILKGLIRRAGSASAWKMKFETRHELE